MPRGTSPSRVRLRETCVYRSRGKVFELSNDGTIAATRDRWLDPPVYDYEANVKRFVASHKTELNDWLASTRALRSAANEMDVEDIFGQAQMCVVDGLRAAIPGMTRETKL